LTHTMQLTLYTDYSLRVLVFLSVHPEKTITITEISDFYEISRNHLVKIVHNLATLGYIQSFRGKGGGLRLAKPPEEINIGDVVRKVEPHFNIVECFGNSTLPCKIQPLCALKSALNRAGNTFLEVLDQYTLADAITPGSVTDFPLTFRPGKSMT